VIAFLSLIPGAILAGYVFVDRAIALKLLFACLAAPWFIVLISILRAGVVLSASEVEVRGILRDRHVRWNDVTGFEFVRGNPLNSNVYIAVKLINGSHLETSDLAAASNTSKYGLRVMAEMERLRQKWA
jgi:hypothetical protein